eukprot:3666950-Rhodomonas_salina.3
MTIRQQGLHITKSTFCFDLVAMCKSGGAISSFSRGMSTFWQGLPVERWWKKVWGWKMRTWTGALSLALPLHLALPPAPLLCRPRPSTPDPRPQTPDPGALPS